MIEKNDFGIVWLKISKSIFHFNEDVLSVTLTFHLLVQNYCKTEGSIFFEETEKGLEKYSKMGKT